ncbi:MAG: OsmC family protein [Chloroflexi bacterium]|nr:OsmC family protein [Chloroflexota bacterium]
MAVIRAQVRNSQGLHDVVLKTDDVEHAIIVPPKSSGYGSSANGGELLFLALATCYCNDLYREAAKRNIAVQSVLVEVIGEFDDAPGSAARNIQYRAAVQAQASDEEIRDLMRYTDTVAEVQNTLRAGTKVTLVEARTHAVT